MPLTGDAELNVERGWTMFRSQSAQAAASGSGRVAMTYFARYAEHRRPLRCRIGALGGLGDRRRWPGRSWARKMNVRLFGRMKVLRAMRRSLKSPLYWDMGRADRR